ncbi:MAG: hypothetical protein ACFE0O_05545 [Opitutales bacterium]
MGSPSNASTAVRELAYPDYEARQREEITPEGLADRLRRLGVGGRATWRAAAGRWEPQPYPGWALQAMADRAGPNRSTIESLVHLREALCRPFEGSGPDRPPALFPLPRASFHQTVANTFSADRRERHLVAPGLEAEWPRRIARSLARIRVPRRPDPVCMRLIGISLFRTAIGILGVFPQETHFDRVVGFRDAFYSDTELTALGLERTRPFIGHITLAYVERSLTAHEGEALVDRIVHLNGNLPAEGLPYLMPEARLHRYDTLAAFVTRPDWPAIQL